FFQAEDGIRDGHVTGVQTCALPISEDAGFFLVAWLLDIMSDARANEGLRGSEERLEAIRQKYGLEDDSPGDSDDVPAEHREALRSEERRVGKEGRSRGWAELARNKE